MTALEALRDEGQSIWLDSISREMLETGTLARYISDFSVTGLTSNPTIFQKAVSSSDRYDEAIRRHVGSQVGTEEIFFSFALEDITEAADLLRKAHDASDGRDGFASLEVSPKLADDAERTITEAKSLHDRAGRPNVLIKVPGTRAGCKAIEELIAAGIPINVTLLFSRDQYRGAAEAYLRGIERRLQEGKSAAVPSVASLFVSRWDAHTASNLTPELSNRLGIAVAQHAYAAYREILASERWQKLARAGARPQRLLFASTGTKDPALPEDYYVTALAAPDTVDTMPEKTLHAFAEKGSVKGVLAPDAREAERVIAAVEKAGVDVGALGTRLQVEGRDAFVASWEDLLACVGSKRRAMQAA